MRLPPLAISYLTAAELPPPAMIDAAAQAGCQHAGIRMLPVVPDGGAYPLMHDPALLRETLAAIGRTGVTVSDLEIVILRPDTDPATLEAFLDTGARIGARHVLVTGADDQESRLIDNFAALCDRAATYGLTSDLEFLPWSSVPDLATAIRIIAAASRPNAGIVLDPLHFDRSDSRLDDIARIPRSALHYWQMCDAAFERPTTTEGLLYTAREERLFPGEGGLDLLGLVRAMPADLPISIEVPKAGMARTVPGPERIRRAADATRALLARAATHQDVPA